MSEHFLGVLAVHFRDHVLPGDPQAVREILQATAMFRPNEVDVAEELVVDALQKGSQSDYCFIFAEEEGNVAGYVCFGHIGVTLHSFDLYWIAVHPQRQGQRIGKTLLQQAERLIARRGGRQVFLDTSSLDIYQSTRQFYERCGYELEATVREFYAPGDNKLVYMRKL